MVVYCRHCSKGVKVFIGSKVASKYSDIQSGSGREHFEATFNPIITLTPVQLPAKFCGMLHGFPTSSYFTLIRLINET